MIILSGQSLPALSNPGAAGDLKNGKQLIDANGNVLTGTMPTVTQATPSITVANNGLITASATQDAGYVASGTKSATKQLTTQAGTTITPGTSQKTAVASGRYTTGNVYVAGDSDLKASNIKSGVNIFGVAGTLEQGYETIVVILDSATSQGNYSGYRRYRIYYDGTIPSAPSGGGSWEFVSFMLLAELEDYSYLADGNAAMASANNSIVFTNGGYSMYAYCLLRDISTSYFTFDMASSIYSDHGDITSIMPGSHLVLANSVIFPE